MVDTLQVLLYAFFWMIPWCLNFICQPFGTLSLFHLHSRIVMNNNNQGYYSSYLPAFEDGTDRVFRNVGT